MKATWRGHVIAQSDQTIELDGYQYFPPASVRMEFLQPPPGRWATIAVPTVSSFSISRMEPNDLIVRTMWIR